MASLSLITTKSQTPRRHARIPVSLELRVRTNHRRGHDQVRDISEGGIGVDTSTPLEKDLLISMRLEVPTSTGPIDVLGRVVWSTRDSMGIRFVDPDPELYRALSRLRREVDG
jgi:hypothetical protein